MAGRGYVDFVYEIGADGKPYNPLNGARHYGSRELVELKHQRWFARATKYLGNPKVLSQEALDAHCAMGEECRRLNEADKALYPELW